VAVVIEVVRGEERLVAEPAVRVVTAAIDAGDIRQQTDRIFQGRTCVGVVAVVRGDPVPDGLQRRSDPVLPLLDEVEWDGSGLVGLEQLLLFAFELGSPGRKVGEFGGPFGHHLVEPGIEHRLPGAVASATMPARTHEMRVNRALTALRVADPRRSGRAPAAATASPRTDHRSPHTSRRADRSSGSRGPTLARLQTPQQRRQSNRRTWAW
ncbi:MAG TPA: hypothetical protein PKE34_07260, partial [Marmoricola sp.]|nr:hypothetical protein [Marmoricola sp.]